MFDPTVRPATLDDLEVLHALERDARSALVDARGGQRWLETHVELGARWDESIASGNVAVGHIDGVVVGFVQTSQHLDVATVEQVYVDPGARQCGFGDELLAWALTVARARGATVFEAEALPGDRDTKNLYERAGITARLIVVSTRLA
jgi:GNAT superfamily N-acetyltransferase